MVSLQIQAEAYAFRQLVEHLQWRTDVQNIDLMNLAGFCRNCLSKWYAAGSKQYGMPIEYSEATTRVYGMSLADWKKAHQGKATDEQMAAFEGGKAKHARIDAGPPLAAGGGGHSSVCGQECEAPTAEVLPSSGPPVSARLAILTCSDRASAGVYADLSGPAVAESFKSFAERSGGAFAVDVAQCRVLPDDQNAIAEVLTSWSDADDCDLLVTTGGTGLGPRDVTPEATRRVIVRLAEGLTQAMAYQTSFAEPHSVLSRGVCGVTAKGALVINLPGNPAAVRQCLSVILPVLPHALRQMGRRK